MTPELPRSQPSGVQPPTVAPRPAASTPAMYSELDAERTPRRLSSSQLAAEVGLCGTPLKHLAAPGRFEVDGVRAIAAWLDRPQEGSPDLEACHPKPYAVRR